MTWSRPTRRDVLAAAAKAAALIGFGRAAQAMTGPRDAIVLRVPHTARLGESIPITVSASGARTVLIRGSALPHRTLAEFRFETVGGTRTVSLRTTLSQSQVIEAVAELADGTLDRATANVSIADWAKGPELEN